MGKHKGGKKANQQQQQQQQPQQHPARDAAQVPSPEEAAAPAAQQDPLTQLQEYAQQRKEVADKLRLTERQIYDLETKYLENCNSTGNALIGYEGLLQQVQPAKNKSKNQIKPEDRLFSGSSITGTQHLAHR